MAGQSVLGSISSEEQMAKVGATSSAAVDDTVSRDMNGRLLFWRGFALDHLLCQGRSEMALQAQLDGLK